MKRLLLFSFFIILLSACKALFQKEIPPKITFTGKEISISELKNSYKIPGTFSEITQDVYISGTVVANSQSGNFYQTIIIQDESAAIPILLENRSAQTNYPLNSYINVKCQGLMLSSNNPEGTLQLGYESQTNSRNQATLGLIEANLEKTHFVKTDLFRPVTPKTIYISELQEYLKNLSEDSLLKDLVQHSFVTIDAIQFSEKSLNKTYGDETEFFFRHTLEDKNNYTLNMPVSKFSDFAKEPVPKQSGSIQGILILSPRRGKSIDLKIRILQDVALKNTRILPDLYKHKMTIAALKQNTVGTVFPKSSYIEGVIISHPEYESFTPRNSTTKEYKTYYIQDETGGIGLYLSDSREIDLNKKVKVALSGLSLSTFPATGSKTNLQIAQIKDIAETTQSGLVTPANATIETLYKNAEQGSYSGFYQLITLENIFIKAVGSTYYSVSTDNKNNQPAQQLILRRNNNNEYIKNVQSAIQTGRNNTNKKYTLTGYIIRNTGRSTTQPELEIRLRTSGDIQLKE